MSNILPPNAFRANVGSLIINNQGQVLAFERHDIKGSWQMPQGGIEGDEDPIDAVYRELEAEANLSKESLKLIDEYPDWIAYELPKKYRSEKYGRGQVQKWFVFKLLGNEFVIDLKNAVEKEFTEWKWMNWRELIEYTAEFRKPVYEKLFLQFSIYLK